MDTALPTDAASWRSRITRRRLLPSAVAGAGGLGLAACGAGSTGTGAGTTPSGQTGAGQKLSGAFEFWQPWPIEQPTHGGPIGWKQLSENYNLRGGPKVAVVTPSGNINEAVQARL